MAVVTATGIDGECGCCDPCAVLETYYCGPCGDGWAEDHYQGDLCGTITIDGVDYDIVFLVEIIGCCPYWLATLVVGECEVCLRLVLGGALGTFTLYRTIDCEATFNPAGNLIYTDSITCEPMATDWTYGFGDPILTLDCFSPGTVNGLTLEECP